MRRATRRLVPLLTARPTAIPASMALFGCVLGLMVLLSAPALAGDGVANYYAVIVGIADFEGTGSDLNYTDDDARDMQAALLGATNWRPENIQLILDRDATRDAIHNAIIWMVGAADDDDVILLFYSSHGGQLTEDLDPVDEPDGFDEFLCTTNFLNIRDDELSEWLAAAVTPNVIVMIDTCFSGGNIKDLPPGVKIKTINPNPAPPNMGNGIAEDILRGLQKPGTRDLDDNGVGVVLTACDGDEYSIEVSDMQNGLFTEYVLEAIIDPGTGFPGDVNSNEWVSGEETFAYAEPLVVAYYPWQNPQLYDADVANELDYIGMGDTPPQPPRSISAFDSAGDEGGSITVVWSKSRDDGRGQNDVTGYTVQRGPSEGGPFTNIASLPAGSTIYLDDTTIDETDYWYRVRVHDALYTSDSDVAGPAQSRDDLAPDAIDNLIAADTQADNGGSNTLNWYGYLAPGDFDHYRVYRAESSFTSVTNASVTLLDDTQTNVSNQAYRDSTAVDGTQYWYAVTAVDDHDNEESTVTPAGPVVSSPNYSFSYPPGSCIMAIGADTTETDLGALFGVPTGTLLAARWDPTTEDYRRYWDTPTDSYLKQALGRAFWLSTPDAILLDVSGQPAPAGNFTAAFVSGWNMIGNPYTTNLDITAATVTVGGETELLNGAAARRWTRDYMWGYDAFLRSYTLISPSIAFAGDTIPKGRGVFFLAFTNGGLTLPRPGDAAAPAAAGASDNVITPDWQMRLVAECENGADVDNFVGVSSQSDKLNAVAGPPAMGIDLYFEDAAGVHTAASFVEPGAGGLTCSLKVAVTSPGPVVLRWPDLSAVPADLKPVLVDTATGKRTYMRTASGYAFDADGVREFELSLRPAAAGGLVVQSMAATRTVRGAQVVFTLSADAAASIEIMNVAGRSIRALMSGVPVAGGETVTVAWDGRSAGGPRVPPGRYLVRITAVAEDGQQTSAVTAMSVGR